MRMSFDGVVGDMGSRVDRGVVYDVIYVGKNDPKAMDEFVRSEAKRKGVEVERVVSEVTKDGKLKTSVTFRSMKGVM